MWRCGGKVLPLLLSLLFYYCVYKNHPLLLLLCYCVFKNTRYFCSSVTVSLKTPVTFVTFVTVSLKITCYFCYSVTVSLKITCYSCYLLTPPLGSKVVIQTFSISRLCCLFLLSLSLFRMSFAIPNILFSIYCERGRKSQTLRKLYFLHLLRSALPLRSAKNSLLLYSLLNLRKLSNLI